MIIAGTGTRQIIRDLDKTKRIIRVVEERLKTLEATLVISGMAEGFDEVIARAAINLGIPFKAYVPNKGYLEYYWGRNSQTGRNRLEVAHKLLEKAVEVQYICTSVYVGGKHSNLLRNEAMVDDADMVLAFVAKNHSSGTEHCMQYAYSCEKRVEIINED